ncbi:MAG: DUF1631 family protein [Hahellaceae bacterium]|nr:DUF1631 family protein [Hahellaceae bacterium]MCP5212912.1 DUF1631 family protein [Hahellaceae bacterium]
MHPIALILKNLRVPDLPYRMRGSVEDDAAQKEKVLAFLLDPLTRVESQSTLKTFREMQPKQSLLPKWFNSFFLADRLIDVYLRKNDFSPELEEKLSHWRFALAYIFVYLGQGHEHPENFVHLLRTFDTFAKEYVGYSAAAARGKLVIEALERLNLKIFVTDIGRPGFQAELFGEIEKEFKTNNERRRKIVERLVQTEQGLSRSEHAGELSRRIVASALDGRLLPESISDFVTEVWVELLRQKVLTENIETMPPALDVLTKDLYLTFSTSVSMQASKKQEIAISLVDRLETELGKYEGRIPDYQTHLGRIQKDVIDQLQAKPVEVQQFLFGDGALPKTDGKVLVQNPEQYENVWIEVKDLKLRHQVTLWLPLTQTYLMTNLLGMKTGYLKYAALMTGLQTGAIRRVSEYVSLESIIDETVRGLSKVVSAQMQQRQQAIDKAKREAEEIRLAKERAEAEVAERKRLAKEEAARLQAQAASEKAAAEAQQQRIKELELTEAISDLKMGAWVEFTRRDELEKGKLAVKTKATQKLIFVDKLGLNRFEIKVDELVAQVLEGKARILDSGTEFDDSLERTVSRIRMSTK